MGIATPETLQDIRAMLDNDDIINRAGHPLMEIGSDHYFVDENDLQNVSDTERGMYLWTRHYPADDIGDWYYAYQAIMLANVALESLERVGAVDEQKGPLKGEALFIRAFQHYCLAQVFAPPYLVDGDNSREGIPLKLSSNFEEKTQRASVKEVYDQIEEDLNTALSLLPDVTMIKTRPSKAAVYALKARMYLAMRSYDRAFDMADKALGLYSTVLDLNTLDLESQSPFPLLHEEIMYACYGATGFVLSSLYANVSPELYKLYKDGDLRKEAYFYEKTEDRIGLKGDYIGIYSTVFPGLCTDEMYLIRAEISIRKGEVEKGLADLNKLLAFKYRSDSFQGYGDMEMTEALDLVLTERRKQLLFRGLRWSDLKRLNQEGREITLYRFADDGQTVIATLPPNDPRYIFLIPDNVVHLSGIKQNIR